MDKKMEVVIEALCSFFESRAESVSEYENILLPSKKFTPEEYKHIFEALDLTQNRLKNVERQKKYDSFPCKGGLAFTFLVIILIMSVAALFTKLWGVGMCGLGITGCLSFMYFTNKKRSGKNENWLYMLELKLRLLLWKIPPIDNDMKNPRCVFVYFNGNNDSENWITSSLLPKLKQDLGIKMSDELTHLLQNADFSSSEFQDYSYWSDALIGPLGNVPLWCFGLLFFVCILVITAAAIYYGNTIVRFVSFLSFIVTVLGVFYKFLNPTNKPTGPDIEANKQSFDIICRLHRVMRNETIFFTLVNFGGEIPKEMSQYFKFFIKFESEYLLYIDTYHHLFYCKYDNSLSELHFAESPAYEKLDKFLKVVLQHVRDRLLTPAYPSDSSVISKNAIEVLPLFVKTNDSHNILSSIDILRTVCRKVVIEHTNPGKCMFIFRSDRQMWEVDVSSQLTPEIHLSRSDFETLANDENLRNMYDCSMYNLCGKFYIGLNEF